MPKYSANKTGFARLWRKHDGRVFNVLRESILLRLWRNNNFRRIVRSISKRKTPKRWLFIVGCYNSGTKLLTEMLAAHQEIAFLPQEGRFLTDGFPNLLEGGWSRMMYMNRDKWVMPKADKEAICLRDRIIKDWSPLFGRQQNQTVFMDKSICHSTRIEWLNKYFTVDGLEPYFVHIVRNGNVVAQSVQKRGAPKGDALKAVGTKYPLDICAKQWVTLNECILKDVRGKENYTLVHFEKLVQNPKQVMDNLINQIGLTPADVEIIGEDISINNVVFEIKKDIDQGYDNGIEEHEFAILNDITKRLNKMFGYARLKKN